MNIKEIALHYQWPAIFDMFKRWFVTDDVALAGILLWPAQLSIELFIRFCMSPKM